MKQVSFVLYRGLDEVYYCKCLNTVLVDRRCGRDGVFLVLDVDSILLVTLATTTLSSN